MRYTAAALALNKGKQENHSILIYGPPKTGKTRLVATASLLPEIKKIYWFDGENGSSTILNMGLPQEALDKFVIFKFPDTKDNPKFIEGLLKMLSSKVKIFICDEHGQVGCTICKHESSMGEFFLYSETKHDEIIVIDSGSQAGVSALNSACFGKGDLFKPGFDEYGAVGKWLTDMLLTIQQARYANFVVITHELNYEGEDGVERIYPLMGTKSFSTNVSKFFGTVVYTLIKVGKHTAGSSSTFKPNLITGSRLNIKMENAKEPDMRTILIEGGIIK